MTPELQAFLRDVEWLEHQGTDAIIETLQSLGVFRTADESWSAEQIVEHCQLQPRFGGLIARWLRFLAADGVLISGSSQRYSCARPLVRRPKVGTPVERGTADNPLIGYFDTCRRNLVPLLRGEANPLDFLFPGGDWRIAKSIYEHNPLAHRVNGQAASIVQELVAQTTGPIRVLELGGGTGSLTSSLLPVLPPDRTQYLFTDVTQFFHAQAKRKFARFPFVEFGMADILRDPLTQGLLPHSYDLIVAANVLHNAEEPVPTLSQLRPLLAGGGVILLVEATRNTRAHAVTVGLIEGLSRPTQEEDRPFLPLARWIEALEAAGFGEVETGGDPTDAATDLGLDVIVARAPRPSATERRQAWQTARSNLTGAGLHAFLSQQRPDDMLPADIVVLDAFPLTADGTTDLEALRARQFVSRSHPQPSSATQSALTEIWSTALGRDAVGLHDNFLELGGDSLIAVRLLAGVRERFQFEARAQMLFEYPTVFTMAAEIERRMREQDFAAISDEPWLPAIVADPANAAEPFPLTKIQEAYWIGRSSGLELGNVGAHYYLELEAGSLDRERLESAWQRLIERHGMLRTVMRADGRQQLLVPAPRYRIEKRDLAALSEDEAREVLAQERARMSHQVFSGAQWPSFEIENHADRTGQDPAPFEFRSSDDRFVESAAADARSIDTV